MGEINVRASATIDAPPAEVYAVIADYREGHPAILPKEFTGLTVIEGGRGAGTVIDVSMKVMGVQANYRMTVTEPEPGRVLEERDDAAGVVTRFIVEREDGRNRCTVTIETAQRSSAGLRGWIEQLLNPPVAVRIYRRELQNLAEYVAKRESSTN